MNSGKIVGWMFIFEILLFFIACFVSEDIRIYFIGAGILVLGVGMCSAVLGGAAIDYFWAVWFSLVVLLMGIGTILTHFGYRNWGWPNLVGFPIIGGIGLLFFSVLISNLYKKLVCNEMIMAEYEGCTVHHSTKGPATYTPHFSYRIGYKRYHNVSCGSTISKRSMKKYEKGKEYKIYVDPNKPMIIATSKKLETSDLLMLFWTVGCVVYLIQYCRMVL